MPEGLSFVGLNQMELNPVVTTSGPCEGWLSQGAWGVYLVFQFQLLLSLGLSPGGLVLGVVQLGVFLSLIGPLELVLGPGEVLGRSSVVGAPGVVGR